MASNQFNTKIIKNESGAYSNVPTLFWTDDVETLKNIAKQLSSNDGNHYFITSKEVLNHYCSYEKPNDYNKHILFFSSNTADKIVIPRAIPGKVYKSFQENNVQVNEKLRFDSFNNDKTGYGDQEEKIEGWTKYTNKLLNISLLSYFDDNRLSDIIPITIGDILKAYCDVQNNLKDKAKHKSFVEKYLAVYNNSLLISFKEDKKTKNIDILLNGADATADSVNAAEICGMVSSSINNNSVANTIGKGLLCIPNPWTALAGGIICTVSAAFSVWDAIEKRKEDIVENLKELEEIFEVGVSTICKIYEKEIKNKCEFKYIINNFIKNIFGFKDLDGEPVSFGKDVIIGYLEPTTNKLINNFWDKLDYEAKKKFTKQYCPKSALRTVGFFGAWKDYTKFEYYINNRKLEHSESNDNDNYYGDYELIPSISNVELGWKIYDDELLKYIIGVGRSEIDYVYSDSGAEYSIEEKFRLDFDNLKFILNNGCFIADMELNEKLLSDIPVDKPITLRKNEYVYKIIYETAVFVYDESMCFSDINGKKQNRTGHFVGGENLIDQYTKVMRTSVIIKFKPDRDITIFSIDKSNFNTLKTGLVSGGYSVEQSFNTIYHSLEQYDSAEISTTKKKPGLLEGETYVSLKQLSNYLVTNILKENNLFIIALPSEELGQYATIDYTANSLISKYTVDGIRPYKREKRNIKIINTDKYYNLLSTSTPYVKVGFADEEKWNYFDSRETPFITSVELNDKGVKTLKLKMFDKDFASYSRIDKNGNSLPSLEECIRKALGKNSYIDTSESTEELEKNKNRLLNYQEYYDYNDGRRWEFKKDKDVSLSNLVIEFGYTDANQSWADLNDEYTDDVGGIKKYSPDKKKQLRSHRWWNLDKRYTFSDWNDGKSNEQFKVFNLWKNKDTKDNYGRWEIDKYNFDSSDKDTAVSIDWMLNDQDYTIHDDAINKVRIKQVLNIQEQSTVGFRPCEFMITKFESNLEREGISYSIEAVEIKQFKLNNYKIKQRYEVLKGTPVDVLYMLMRIFNEDKSGHSTASNVRLFWAEPFSIFNDVEISTDDTGRQVKKPKEITVSLGTQNAYYNWNYEGEEKNTRIYYKTIAEILNEFCAACPPLKEANTNVSLKDYNGNEISTEDSSNDIIRPLEWSVGRRAGDSSNDEVCVFLHYRRPTKVNVIREYKWGPGVFGLVSPVENVKIKNKNEFAVLGSIKSFDNFLNKKIERTLSEPKQSYTSESGGVIEYSRKVEKEDANIIGGVLVNRINGQSTNDKYELAYSNCLYEGEIDLPGDPFYDFDDAMIPFCYPIKFSAYIPVGEAERKDVENTTFGEQSGRSRKHYLSGYYVVKEITHKIDYSGYSTKLKVMSYPGIGRDIGLPEFYNNKNLEKVEDAISEYSSRDYIESNNRLVTTIPIERSPNYKNNVLSTQNKESRIVFGKESFAYCCFMSSLIRGFEDVVHANIMNNVKVAKNAGVNVYEIAKEMVALAKGEKKESSVVFCGLRDDESIKNMIKSYDNYILKSEELFLSSSAFSIVDMFWYSNTRNKYMGSGEEKNYLTSKENFLNALEEGYAKTQGQKESEYKWKYLESDPLGTLVGNITDFNADIVIANCTKVDGSGYSVGDSHFVLLDKNGKIIWNSGGHFNWALGEKVIYKIQRFNRVKKS